MSRIEIRDYQEEDFSEFMKLELELLEMKKILKSLSQKRKEDLSKFSLQQTLCPQYNSNTILQGTGHSYFNSLVILDNNQLKGFLRYELKEKDNLIWFRYLKNYDNTHNYGKELLSYSLNYFQRFKKEYSTIKLRAISKAHERYYKKFGFITIGYLKNSQGEKDFIMQRNIS